MQISKDDENRIPSEQEKKLTPMTKKELWEEELCDHLRALQLQEGFLPGLIDGYVQTGAFDYGLLARIREESQEFAEGLVQELLAVAAERDDFAAFCGLLDHVPHAGFTRRLPHAVSTYRFGLYNPESHKCMHSPVFITEKTTYLEEIVRRFGTAGATNKEYYYCLEPGKPNWLVTDLPEAWLAVLVRNLPLTRFFHAHGAYGDGTFGMLPGTGKPACRSVNYQPSSEEEVDSHGNIYNVWYTSVENLYQTARLTGDPEVLRWVQENYPLLREDKDDLPHEQSMLAAAIYHRDPRELEAYMELAKAKGRDANADFRALPEDQDDWGCVIYRRVPDEERARFYFLALTCLTDEAARIKLLEQLIHEDFPQIQGPLDAYLDGIRDVGPAFQCLFYATDPQFTIGYQHLLIRVLRRSLTEEDPRTAIDWYAFSEEIGSWGGGHLANFIALARIAKPREIRRETDPLLREVVTSNRPAAVEYAINEGFITSRNAPFFRMLPNISREITELLLKLDSDVPMDTLYDL